MQQPHGLAVIRDMQDRAFEPGRLGQFGEHARQHAPAAEWLPVGVPPSDGGMQLALGGRGPVLAAEPYRGQQQRRVRIGNQKTEACQPATAAARRRLNSAAPQAICTARPSGSP